MEIDKLKMQTLVISNNMQESHKNNNEGKKWAENTCSMFLFK